MRGIIYLLLIFITFHAQAQLIRIVDNDTHRPIELATIASNNPRLAVTTDASGTADISGFAGAGTIEIRHVSYQTIQLSYKQLRVMKELALKQNRLAIDEVVISANRWEQSVYEIPNKITAISEKDIDRGNPQTSADLLAQTGEVFVQKSQLGGGSPKLRGFSANSILLVVDGVRMNNAIYRSGNLQNVINIDPNALEGAEVVFGPGSVIYGSDALGGVMDFHTKDLKYNSDSLNVSGSALMRHATAANELTVHADLHLGTGKVASYTSLGFSEFGDLRAGSHRADGYSNYGKREFYVSQNPAGEDIVIQNDDPNLLIGSGFTGANFIQKLGLRINDESDLTYGFYYSTTSDIPRYDRLIETDSDGLPADAEWYYGPQKWMMHNLRYKLVSSTALFDQAKFTAAYQQYEESRNDRGFQDNRLRTRTETVDLMSVNMDFDKITGSGNLYYGAEYLYNDIDSKGIRYYISRDSIATTTPRYPDGGSQYTSAAVYANYKWNINEAFTFNSGLRYSHVSIRAKVSDQSELNFPFDELSLDNGALNGSLGLVYSPAPTLKVSGALASGFRSPNVDDIGKVFDFSNGELQVPNSNLEPEYSYNAELAIESRFSNWEFGLTGFYTLVDNAMVRQDFRFNGLDSVLYNGEMSKTVALTNTGEARIYGLSGEVEYFINSNWTFDGSIAWMTGRDITNDEPLRHTTPLFGKVGLDYQQNKVWASFYSEFNGSRLREDIPTSEIDDKPFLYAMHDHDPAKDGSPGWYTLNIKFSYELTNHIHLSGGVENILDKHYRPYSSGISAPGRNFIVALRAGF